MSRFIPAPAPTAPDARIALLRAHSEILSRLALYARAVDRLDEQLIIRQFWPDCEIDMGAVQGTGHAALSTKVLKIFATQQHPVSNVRIVLDASGTRARSEATLTARSLLKVPGSKDAWVVSGLNGRYLDEWELRDDEWRIRKRKLVQDFATTTPIRGDPSYSSARSVEDPSYAFFGEIDVSKVIPKDQKQLEDAAEIVDRLYSFSIGRDSDDVKLMKRCVWSEKMVGKKPTSGPFANGTDLHLQSYPLIVFPSATTALTETYAHGCGYHSNTEAAAWGRYLDFWDKRAGLWRITKRTYVQDGGVTRIPVSGDAVRLPRLAHLLLPRLRPKSDIQSLSMLQLQQTALQQFYRSLSRMDRGQIPSLLGFQKGTKMAHAAHGETVEIEAGGTVQVHALVRAIGVVEDTREIRSGYVSMRMGLDEEDRLVLMSRSVANLVKAVEKHEPIARPVIAQGTTDASDPIFSYFDWEAPNLSKI